MKSSPVVGAHVAVVGGGFTGTMLAVALAALGVRVTLLDRRGAFAEGLAYSTREPAHLLNVPAARMSAFANQPDHFARWLQKNPAGFAQRRDYRRYLAEILDTAGPALRKVEGEAVSMEAGALNLSDGSRIDAEAIALCMGNLVPEPIAMLAENGIKYVNAPWGNEGAEAFDRLAGSGGDVLMIGTGLTMIDAVLSLRERNFEGRIIALSRRGLLPRAHAPFAPESVDPPTSLRLADLMRWVRLHSARSEWRAVVDSLRPITARIWRGWADAERSRFVRHARPWWDVHRHRIAPEVAERLQGMIAEERLNILAGRVVAAQVGVITIRARGGEGSFALRPAAIVNCTGPQSDIRQSRDPLVSSLLGRGLARADPFGLGFEVDQDGRIAGGKIAGVKPALYAAGPLIKGAHWETVAVPDIRVQVERLAATIAADLAAQPESSWHAAPAAG